jgi:hypothetical protein
MTELGMEETSNYKTENEQSMCLWYAVMENNVTKVKESLALGANLNWINSDHVRTAYLNVCCST